MRLKRSNREKIIFKNFFLIIYPILFVRIHAKTSEICGLSLQIVCGGVAFLKSYETKQETFNKLGQLLRECTFFKNLAIGNTDQTQAKKRLWVSKTYFLIFPFSLHAPDLFGFVSPVSREVLTASHSFWKALVGFSTLISCQLLSSI